MYIGLEEQIDTLIQKSNIDLKNKIIRLVTRHTNKVLKQQACDLKNNKYTTTRRNEIHTKTSYKAQPRYREYSDSDSDSYYSK